eukprot:scaffold34688_cov234-Amphora_coffeaeformis.AAC.2
MDKEMSKKPTTQTKNMGFARLSFGRLIILSTLAFLGALMVFDTFDLDDLFPFLDSSDDSSDSSSSDSLSSDNSASSDSSDTAWFSLADSSDEPPAYTPFDQTDLTSGMNGP